MDKELQKFDNIPTQLEKLTIMTRCYDHPDTNKVSPGSKSTQEIPDRRRVETLVMSSPNRSFPINLRSINLTESNEPKYKLRFNSKSTSNYIKCDSNSTASQENIDSTDMMDQVNNNRSNEETEDKSSKFRNTSVRSNLTGKLAKPVKKCQISRNISTSLDNIFESESTNEVYRHLIIGNCVEERRNNVLNGNATDEAEGITNSTVNQENIDSARMMDQANNTQQDSSNMGMQRRRVDNRSVKRKLFHCDACGDNEKKPQVVYCKTHCPKCMLFEKRKPAEEIPDRRRVETLAMSSPNRSFQVKLRNINAAGTNEPKYKLHFNSKSTSTPRSNSTDSQEHIDSTDMTGQVNNKPTNLTQSIRGNCLDERRNNVLKGNATHEAESISDSTVNQENIDSTDTTDQVNNKRSNEETEAKSVKMSNISVHGNLTSEIAKPVKKRQISRNISNFSGNIFENESTNEVDTQSITGNCVDECRNNALNGNASHEAESIFDSTVNQENINSTEMTDQVKNKRSNEETEVRSFKIHNTYARGNLTSEIAKPVKKRQIAWNISTSLDNIIENESTNEVHTQSIIGNYVGERRNNVLNGNATHDAENISDSTVNQENIDSTDMMDQVNNEGSNEETEAGPSEFPNTCVCGNSTSKIAKPVKKRPISRNMLTSLYTIFEDESMNEVNTLSITGNCVDEHHNNVLNGNAIRETKSVADSPQVSETSMRNLDTGCYNSYEGDLNFDENLRCTYVSNPVEVLQDMNRKLKSFKQQLGNLFKDIQKFKRKST